jgi:exopolysaccharide biosynthesis polyprenyl glycosylphosphotransferase
VNTVTKEKVLYKVFPLSRDARHRLMVAVLLTTDTMALGFALWLAYILRFDVLLYYSVPLERESYLRLVLVVIPVALVIFYVHQLYNPDILLGGLREYARVFNAVTVGVVLLIAVDFLRREQMSLSRGWLALTWIIAILSVGGLRFLVRRFIFYMRGRGHFLVPALIVGANDEGRAMAEQLQYFRHSGLLIVGFIDDDLPVGARISNGYEVIGCLKDVESFVLDRNVEEVIVAPTALKRNQLLELFTNLNPLPDVNLRLSSGLFEIFNTGLRIKEVAFVPLIEVNKNRITGPDAFIKAVLDYGLSILVILIVWPILLLIALVIRLDSPGPVFYRRRVMRRNGGQFDALKFRTMRIDSDRILDDVPDMKSELERNHKLKDDPRITRAGAVIRKYSLDELPQILNVLAGQMSLVGPRMISPPEMQEYGKMGMNLLTVKPGITGVWQVSGRSDVSYDERVRLDMHYIRNWSIWMDMYLILRTIPAVLNQKGAY